MTVDVGYYTMADAANCAGLVAMMASLRRAGAADRVTVLDLGLTTRQRLELRSMCTVVELPAATGRHPFFLGAFPHLLDARGVVVCIDADVLVTGALDDIIGRARQGAVCAFPDFLSDRWSATWEPVFALAGPLRHGTYVNTGFLAFSTDHHPTLLRRWWECCERISGPARRPYSADDAIWLADQDVCNALLLSEVPPRVVSVPEGVVAVQGRERLLRTTVVDRGALRCTYEDRPVVVLHAYGLPKPWQRGATIDLARNAYAICLRELLTAPDAPRVAEWCDVPGWLTRGVAGDVAARATRTRFAVDRRVRRIRAAVGRRIKPAGDPPS